MSTQDRVAERIAAKQAYTGCMFVTVPVSSWELATLAVSAPPEECGGKTLQMCLWRGAQLMVVE